MRAQGTNLQSSKVALGMSGELEQAWGIRAEVRRWRSGAGPDWLFYGFLQVLQFNTMTEEKCPLQT